MCVYMCVCLYIYMCVYTYCIHTCSEKERERDGIMIRSWMYRLSIPSIPFTPSIQAIPTIHGDFVWLWGPIQHHGDNQQFQAMGFQQNSKKPRRMACWSDFWGRKIVEDRVLMDQHLVIVRGGVPKTGKLCCTSNENTITPHVKKPQVDFAL